MESSKTCPIGDASVLLKSGYFEITSKTGQSYRVDFIEDESKQDIECPFCKHEIQINVDE
jgi:hypothetical protein